MIPLHARAPYLLEHAHWQPLNLYPLLTRIAAGLQITTYCEIGSWKGDSLRAVVQGAAETLVQVVGIDPLEGAFGGPLTPDGFAPMLREAGYRGTFTFRQGYAADVCPTITGIYDLILVDGDHSYAAAMHDLTWALAHGRVVALHDLNLGGVWQAYQRVAARTWAIANDWQGTALLWGTGE